MELNFIQAYGVMGYSMGVSLALACAGVGIAYWRAGRGRWRAAFFVASALLFAVQFAYLVLVSVDPPWLDRTVTQPYLRTVALVAALCGWGYLLSVVCQEAECAKQRLKSNQKLTK